jgi:hypothetical protein
MERAAVFTQQLLHAADRKALIVQKILDAADKQNVFGPVVAPAAAALEGADLLELAFPETQDVLGNGEVGCDFADRAESRGGFQIDRARGRAAARDIGHLFGNRQRGLRKA